MDEQDSTPTVIMKAPLSVKAAAWLSAITAFFSLQTAMGVYEGEKYRLELEKLRITYEANLEYAKFVAERPYSVISCVGAMMRMKDENFIVSLLKTPTRDIDLKYDAELHKPLEPCLGEAKVVDGIWRIPKQHPFQREFGARLDRLDTLLITYQYEIGKKEVVCENLLGIFLNANGAVGEFFIELERLEVLRPNNFPNLLTFLADYKRMPAPKTCDRYKAPVLERNMMLESMQWASRAIRDGVIGSYDWIARRFQRGT